MEFQNSEGCEDVEQRDVLDSAYEFQELVLKELFLLVFAFLLLHSLGYALPSMLSVLANLPSSQMW